MQTPTFVRISIAAMLAMAGNMVEAQRLMPQIEPVEDNMFYKAAMHQVKSTPADEKLQQLPPASPSEVKARVEKVMQEHNITTRAQVPAYVAQAEELEHPITFMGMCQVAFYPDGSLYLPYGVYKFGSRNGFVRESLCDDLDACINLGSAYIGNKLHGYSNIQLKDPNAAATNRYYGWDTDTWLPVENSGYRDNKMAVVSDYDPVTQKVYGFGSPTDWSYNFSFNTYDYVTKEKEFICNTDDYILCMAINSHGEAYVLNGDYELCHLDLTNGQTTPIGRLDVDVYVALQDMTFDERTDKLYLCISSGSPDGGMMGNIFEVDVNDAHTRLVANLPEAEEYTCLRVLYTPEDDCPADIADLMMRFDGSSSEGKITFTLPATSMIGQPLSCVMNYVVEVDDEPFATGSGDAGEQIMLPVSIEKEGTHKVVVVVSNTIGEGNRNAAVGFVGNDTPMVRDLTFEYDAESGDAVLNWTANSGKFYGYVDPSAQTFRVVRYPDMVVVADNLTECTFTDNLSEVGYHGYSYEVTACVNGEAGVAVRTSSVRAGKAYETPYSVALDSYNDSTQFTVVDVNQDGFSWTVAAVEVEMEVYQYRLMYEGSPVAKANDWVLLPPVMLEKDYAYSLSFDASPYNQYYSEIMAVGIGESEDPSTFTTLMEPTELPGSFRAMPHYDLPFIADHDGAYRIGFQALSEQSEMVLFVTEISVEKITHIQSPASAVDLVANPGAEGDLSATIEFNAPTTTYAGEVLAAISQIDIYRGNDELIATFADVVPGQHIIYEDLDAVNGQTTYTVTVTNEYGTSVPVSASAYVGEDMPANPSGFYAVDNFDGSVTLYWDEASSVGLNGGYVDTELLTYTIYQYADHDMVKVAVTSGNTYTIEGLNYGSDQELHYFVIEVSNDLGRSETVETCVFVGEPYEIPFHETFEGGYLNHGWYYTTTDYWGSFEIFAGTSADDDDCTAGYYADEAGSHAYLRSGHICMEGVTGPTFSFAFYNVPGLDNAITAMVYADGKPQPDTLCYHNMTEEGFEQGWYYATVKLDAYSEAKYIELAFDAYVGTTDWPYVLLDDIRIVEDLTGIQQLQSAPSADYRMIDLMGRQTSKTVGFGIRISSNGIAEKIVRK